MQRRSTGRSAPRKRYTVDAFEGIEELQDAEVGDGDTPLTSKGDESSGDDFDIGADHEPSEDEDAMSGVEDEIAEASDAGEADLDDNASIAADPDAAQSTSKKKMFARMAKPGILKAQPTSADEKLYTRGQEELKPHSSWYTRRVLLYGPFPEDHEPVWQARNKWAGDPTFPTRRKDAKGGGGYRHSFYSRDEDRRKEAVEGWKWYHEAGGGKAFEQGQSFLKCTEKEARDYLPSEDREQSFVMGPLAEQKLFHLSVGTTMALTDAFQTAGSTSNTYKRGFMLNLGGKVQCVDWAPNQSGSDQYLAACVVPDRLAIDEESKNIAAPAFTPQPPLKSCIQIWRIRAEEGFTIDRWSSPCLKVAMCTRWGDIKAMRWCPVPHEGSSTLGLLAIISGDGWLRVLDAPLPTTGDQSDYLKVEKVAFESRPPDSLFTSVAWFSSSRIAAGCANGFVAVFDLSPSLGSKISKPRPSIYAPISTTYILSIESCYPSRPHLLLTTSMAGYVTITDLRHPQPASPAGSANSQRSRIGQPLLVWHDFAQSAFSMDDLYTLRGYPLRRWFSLSSIARTKGIGTALAKSPVHPILLAGTASGEVVATNPIARFTDTRIDTWQQTWFQHEWRRATPAESTGLDQGTDKSRFIAGENGVSRILEGFKAEKVRVSNESRDMANSKDGVLFHIVHEKETAVTALAWNPNECAGGWAAAGMGNGLVRMEDIGL